MDKMEKELLAFVIAVIAVVAGLAVFYGLGIQNKVAQLTTR